MIEQPKIELAEIEKLAALSRISLTDEEKVSMQKDLGAILGFVTQIQVVSESAPARQPEKVRNIMREDTQPNEGGFNTEAILANVPKKKDNYVQVKKIL